MYLSMTTTPCVVSSEDKRTLPSSRASVRDSKNDSTKWNAAIEACLAAVDLALSVSAEPQQRHTMNQVLTFLC